jgi:hypothetical protein
VTRIGWEKRVNALRQEVTQVMSEARISSGKFQELQKQAECCKVQFLIHQLEVKRRSLARDRGGASVVKDGKGLPAALGFAAVASIVIGIISHDKRATATAGLSSFNGALRGIGETEWAVCLDRQLTVRPRNHIAAGRVWFTWDSVRAALNELEQQAQNRTHLGNFDAVISEVRRSKRLVAVIMQEYKIIT